MSLEDIQFTPQILTIKYEKALIYIVLAPKSLRNLYNSSSCTDNHSTWEIKDSNIVSCSANLTSAKRLSYKGYFLHQEYNHFKDE
jgi:hypothetical protein